jgi:hypothetical protein
MLGIEALFDDPFDRVCVVQQPSDSGPNHGPHSLLGILSIAREHRRALSANAPVAPTIVALGFDCAGIDAARSNAGLNTLLYSASTTPVPDIVAPAATA